MQRKQEAEDAVGSPDHSELIFGASWLDRLALVPSARYRVLSPQRVGKSVVPKS